MTILTKTGRRLVAAVDVTAISILFSRADYHLAEQLQPATQTEVTNMSPAPIEISFTVDTIAALPPADSAYAPSPRTRNFVAKESPWPQTAGVAFAMYIGLSAANRFPVISMPAGTHLKHAAMVSQLPSFLACLKGDFETSRLLAGVLAFPQTELVQPDRVVACLDTSRLSARAISAVPGAPIFIGLSNQP